MLGRVYAGAALRCHNSRGHQNCGQAITVQVGGTVGVGQPQYSNHTIAQPHLRVNLAVRVPDAGKDVCRGCFEMPQQPGASELWPGHEGTSWGPVGVGQPQLSNHTIAQPHLRVNLAVQVPDAGKGVCRGCFEMPQQPGASELWPGHYGTSWRYCRGWAATVQQPHYRAATPPREFGRSSS